LKGIETALRDFVEDTGQNPTQLGLTNADFRIIDKALNGITGSGKPCIVTNPVNGTEVTISPLATGVTSGNAALSGFGEE